MNPRLVVAVVLVLSMFSWLGSARGRILLESGLEPAAAPTPFLNADSYICLLPYPLVFGYVISVCYRRISEIRNVENQLTLFADYDIPPLLRYFAEPEITEQDREKFQDCFIDDCGICLTSMLEQPPSESSPDSSPRARSSTTPVQHRKMPCEIHFFHRQCAEKWRQSLPADSDYTCPKCRQSSPLRIPLLYH